MENLKHSNYKNKTLNKVLKQHANKQTSKGKE